MTGSSKCLLASVAGFYIGSGSIDNLERGLVTGFVVVTPRTHAVMPKQYAFGLRIILYQRLDQQTYVKAGPLPRYLDNVSAIDLIAKPLLIYRSSDSDYCVWVEMIDMFEGYEGVERGVDRARAGV